MIPASYLFKDTQERHWGKPGRAKISAAEDAYYASVCSAPLAIARLWRGAATAALSLIRRGKSMQTRLPQSSSDAACRA